jgi:hypothetical protein
METAGVMNAKLIIDHRDNLAGYADSLDRFRALSPAGKHDIATETCNTIRDIAKNV